MKMNNIRGIKDLMHIDWILTGSVVMLNLVGLLTISSVAEFAGTGMLVKQAAGSAVGLLILFVFSLVDYNWILRFYKWFYGLTVFLLFFVLVFGTTVGGAKRWISIGGFTFQPSEMAKILLILFYAAFIIKYKDRFSGFRIYLISAALMLVPVILTLREPDLSTSIMMVLIFLVILFVSGISGKLVAGTAAVVIPASCILIYLMDVKDNLPFVSAYQQERVRAWLHPEQYLDTTAYQTMNSMMAIGSGGLMGKGLTESGSSLYQTGFVSESQTDFIFAVIGEEFGFIGCVFVVFLIAVIAIRCFRIADRCGDMKGRIIACGVGGWIALQSFLNIGVATGLLPNTGIPLPFVSYGLTAIICLYLGLGITQNVYLSNHNSKAAKPRNLWSDE